MKKIVFTTLAALALVSFATNANAQTRYQGEVNASIGVALEDGTNFLAAGLETVHGVRIHSFFVGGGLGIHEYVWFGDGETSYDAMMPIFANVKYYFLDQRKSPYVGADIGYGFGITDGTVNGLYLSPTIGYNFGLGRKTALHVGLSYQGQSWGDGWWRHGVVAKVGFTW